MKRHNIIAAAKRGGYRSSKNRKSWRAQEDDWLRENWHRRSPQEVATHLGRSVTSVVLRKKRIGIGRYDGTDLTIRDIESVLRVDHRLWHAFIDKGWLKAWQRTRQGIVSAITRVNIEALHRFLREHPQVIDYRNAGTYASGILELAKLPEPPRYKQVRCESSSFTDCVKATPTEFQVHHGDVKMHEVELTTAWNRAAIWAASASGRRFLKWRRVVRVAVAW